MKGLFLCGYGCKPWIWEGIIENWNHGENDIEFIEWPTILTNGFSSIMEFSKWVKDNLLNENEYYDFIVGHSMGGLIALQLSTMYNIKVRNIILIESYITSPGKFFQNLLMESTNQDIKEKVLKMLNEESKYYSPELRNQLRDLDLTGLVKQTGSNIHCIYGDRGINNKERVIRELGLPEEIRKYINMHVIQNCCHFPMIENSEELISLLNTILRH